MPEENIQENKEKNKISFLKRKSKIIIIIILVLVVMGIGFYLYSNFYKRNTFENIKDTENISDSNNVLVDDNVNKDKETGQNIALKEGDSYEYIGIDKELLKNTPVPDLNRTIPSGTTENIKQNIISLSNDLKTNIKSFSLWTNLGLYRKLAGDYEGAKQSWEYSSLLRPRFALSFLNLANLYGYYLKNNIKAEENFLKAIEAEPTEIYSYISASSFYTDVMKDKIKAVGIINKGIENNPKSEELKTILKEIQ